MGVRSHPRVGAGATAAAGLAGGGIAAVLHGVRSLSRVLGCERPPQGPPPRFDLGLIQSDTDPVTLAECLVGNADRGFSLCLQSPPGTGKSAFARYLSECLGLEVLQKHASDLLSPWVGETEQQIAAAFAEARDAQAFLIFDEADSLLANRRSAHRSWEVSQVNEMLTWMESHPLPFACTTNFGEHLDPATLRRFVFGDDRFRRFRRAAGAVQNQVEAIAFEALADLHERLHVLVADGDQPGRCVPLQPPRSVEDDVPPGMSMKLDEVFPANAAEVRRLSAGQLGKNLAPDGHVEASLPAGSACLGRVGCRDVTGRLRSRTVCIQPPILLLPPPIDVHDLANAWPGERRLEHLGVLSLASGARPPPGLPVGHHVSPPIVAIALPSSFRRR